MSASVIQIPTTHNKLSTVLDSALDKLAVTIRTAYQRTQRADQEWIDGTLELAKALQEARQRFESNNDFAQWLTDNKLDMIGKNDRAALMQMAGHIDLTRDVLSKTTRRSWEMIWRNEIQSRVPNVRNTPVTSSKRSTRPMPRSMDTSRWKARSMPRATEVRACFTNQSTLYTLGALAKQRGGRDAWQLILAAIDEGFIVPTDTMITTPSMRLLFPKARVVRGAQAHDSYFARYSLADPRHRNFIRTVIMPVAVANKEAVIADPTCLEGFVANRDRHEQQARVEQQTTEAAKVLPANEYPCIMYGLRIWPRPVTASYDYRQARAATWLFHDLMHMMVNSPIYSTPQARARAIRFATRTLYFCGGEAAKAIVSLTDAIAQAMETSPDGECEPMPKPTDNIW